MSTPPEKLLIQPQPPQRSLKRYVVLVAVAIPFAVLVALAVVITTSKASITTSATALATIKLPIGGAKVETLGAVGGREQKALPVKLIGDTVWPSGQVPAGEKVTIEATIRRPGWNAWLAGKTQALKLTITTPEARLNASYLTVKAGQPIALHFSQPVAELAYGAPGSALTEKTLATPTTSFAVPETSTAGTLVVTAVPRTWETASEQNVSWFPAGSKATAVASPAPGTRLTPQSQITLTFSKPVKDVLNGVLPGVTPAGSGTWQTIDAHAIRYVPSGYGYGLGATVKVALPAGVNLVGGSGDPVGTWSVPAGSTLRLQELLAELGYLPVRFTGASAGDSIADQVAAAVDPPQGSFAWAYPNTPSALRKLWSPGDYGELTKAAVMAFENNEGMTADGIAGPDVWKALIRAVLQHQTNTFGYTFVYVTEASTNENEVTWHNGKNVVSGPVNTGIAAAPTATGVFAVYEHLTVTTMSGTNPDGTPYHDPGIPWVSYFNGGDALHGFIRASYGFPQSLGCVEMPYAEAGQVWPYTPIGTIVDVA